MVRAGKHGNSIGSREPALRVRSRFRSYVRPTSHRRGGSPSIEEPVWVGGDWIIHSSETSSSVIHFMSTLISYQKAYFTKGTVVSREPCNLAVPGNRPYRPGNLRHRQFPQPSLSFLLCLSFWRACGSLQLHQKLSVNYWSYRESTKCWRWRRCTTFGGRGANKFIRTA